MKRGLAYVFSRFPLLSETFLLREVLELERQCWSLELVSIQRDRAAVRHPEAVRLEPRVQFLELASPRTLRSSVRLLRRSPDLYARLLALTVGGNRRSAEFLVKGLAIVPATVELAQRLRLRQVRHIHAVYATHPALLALLAARMNDGSFSFSVHAHDLFVNTTMLVEKLRRASFVTTVSEFNRRRLHELAGPLADEKVRVVRLGVDLETYRFAPRQPVERPWSILAVGSLQEYKGHDRLVRACALLRSASPELPFVCQIVGQGQLRARLEQLIATLGLARQVRLLGPRQQHEVRALMEAADVLVQPSVMAPTGQMEGLPVSLIEAMAVGRPVIASDLSGIPELVRPADTGLLVPPDDPLAIRDRLLETWRDPAATALRVQRARRLVEREYDLKANVRQFGTLFENVVQGPGCSAVRRAPVLRPEP